MNLHQTDPEFMQRWEHFAFEEVVHEEGQQLPEKDRYLAILATLLGCQGKEAFHQVLPKALQGALSPVEVKETVYQAVDYLGSSCPRIPHLPSFYSTGLITKYEGGLCLRCVYRLFTGLNRS